MTEDKKPANDDDTNRFDMYHFFSRWDLRLVVAVVLLLLFWLLGRFLHHGSPGI